MSFAEAFTKATKANFAPDAAVTVKKPSSSASQKPRSSSGSSASTSGAGGSGPHSKPLSSSRPSMGSSNPLVQKDLGQRVKASKPTSKSRGKVYSDEEREQRIKRFDMIAIRESELSQSQPTVNEEDEDELNGIGKETGLPGDALGTAPYPRLSSTSSRQPARPLRPSPGC
ncbi:hypothetical protein BT96DRAFT_175529 [Gymnopus androsaceus JB14]|uniref:Uncharacterized protein n=1 Tax=Gymnopus androsaceus JB14 TaxID=1447944 RepID=A0A6A4IB93_9AGAR|nr:hypothetical protein BT96DRAFT_175529 [Gymnopus androsaceus JB14]